MKILFFPFLILFFFSCTSKQKVPAGVLPLPKVSSVLWDVMEADALVNRKLTVDSSLKRYDTSIQWYQQILKKHNATPEQFKKSIRFYQSRPDLLQIIFDSLQHRADVPVAPTLDSTKTL